jgi:putative isomerase
MLSQEAKRRLAFSESGLEDRPQWSGAEPPSPEAGGPANGAGKQPPPDAAPDARPDARKDAAKFNDKARTLEFAPVGVNALYALDTETMGTIARELGLLAEAGQWQSRHEKIRAAINAKLWSEEDKLYLNRHWDGRFSRRVSLENFYPLLAGLADEERAKQMMEALRDPNRFGLLHPMPSISRGDPSFDGKSAGRGAIWAPMNYLLYLGMRRYGFSDEAGELARRGGAIARAAFEKSGKLHDLFSSVDDSAIDEDGKAWFAGAMLWPAIEELICADPWTGLSFGGVATIEESRVERVNFFGASFDSIVGPKRTVVRRGGKIEIECEAPARLRAYRDHDRAMAFVIETKEETRVLVPAVEGRKITVSMDDKVLGSTSAGASASFKVPAGIHKVLIVK